MKSNIFILIIAVIGFTLLSSPANADVLSFHKTGHMVIVNVTQPTINFYALDSNMGFLLSNNTLEVYPVGAGSNENLMYSEFTLNDGSCTANTGNDCYIDLGAVYKINEIDQFLWQNQKDRTFEWYGSTTSPTTGFSLLVSSAYPDQTTGFKNNTFALTSVRYLRYAFTFASTHFMSVSEIVIQGNPLPNITSWSNSFTNDASLTLSPPIGQNVIFSVTGTSQPVSTYTWNVDGTNQNNNFSSFSSAFSAAQHTVSVTVTNTNGTSTPVTWNINGGFPAPPIAGDTGGGIAWDRSTYTTNQIGNITGNVTIAPPLFGDIRVTVSNQSGSQLAFFVWDSSLNFPQIENFLFLLPSPGTYTARLISHSPFSGDTELASASAQVFDPQSYIFAPANVISGSNITVTYQFNPAPNSGAIEDVYVDSGVGNYVNTTLCTCDTSSHTFNYIINGAGTHILRLWDTTNFKIVATTTVHVVNSGEIVPGTITNNLLLLDNTQYSVNDVINGQYQVSTANWTRFSYIKAYLQSSGGVGMGFVTLNKQTGTFQLPVTGGNFNIIQSGAAFVNMSAGNTSFDPNAIILASVPVTILANNGGYSVTTNPSTICLSQTEVVKYTAPFPTATSAILQVEKLTPAGTTEFTNITFTSNGTRSFTFDPATVKDQSGILFNILDSNGNFQVNSIVKYESTGCTAPGTTPITPTPAPTSTSNPIAAANGLINVLSEVSFYGLVLWLGIVFTVAGITKTTTGEVSTGAVAIVAFLAANFIALIGLFDPFKIYVLVLSWLIIGIYWRISRDSTTGGG